MTRKDLARRAKLNYNYLGDLEEGRRNPTLTVLTKVALGLDLLLSQLLAIAERTAEERWDAIPYNFAFAPVVIQASDPPPQYPPLEPDPDDDDMYDGEEEQRLPRDAQPEPTTHDTPGPGDASTRQA